MLPRLGVSNFEFFLTGGTTDAKVLLAKRVDLESFTATADDPREKILFPGFGRRLARRISGRLSSWVRTRPGTLVDPLFGPVRLSISSRVAFDQVRLQCQTAGRAIALDRGCGTVLDGKGDSTGTLYQDRTAGHRETGDKSGVPIIA